MELSHQQVQLIKHSWISFRTIDPSFVGDVFYGKLFLDNPSFRRMFPKNMDEQYRKLIDMLSVIVGRLDNPNDMLNDIAAMARRHVHYGVKPEHYDQVGKALLWTLENGLGKDWNGELKQAWSSCYNMIATTMIHAASGEKV